MSTGTGKGPRPLTATCSRGLEEVLCAELQRLGFEQVKAGAGAVMFSGDLTDVYRANLHLRTAMRVLMPLASSPAHDRKALYDLATSIPWESFFSGHPGAWSDTGQRATGQTFAVEAVGRSPRLRNTAFAAQVVKDGLVDRLRRRRDWRPDVDRHDPDLRVHLHLAAGRATLSLDTSGPPLSHRGYRPRGGPAPLAETLAAGIILLTGYDGNQPLLDPMSGTGTLAAEAALLATNTPPGLSRSFSFERWHWHDPARYRAVRGAARAAIEPAVAAITACDQEQRAVAATRRNLVAAGVDRFVTVLRRDLAATEQLPPGSIVVCNPPYGHRLGEVEELRPLYRLLGDVLKQRATGCTAWVLAGEPQLAHEIRLRPSRRIVLFNGPTECRLLRFDLYEGSLRSSRSP